VVKSNILSENMLDSERKMTIACRQKVADSLIVTVVSVYGIMHTTNGFVSDPSTFSFPKLGWHLYRLFIIAAFYHATAMPYFIDVFRSVLSTVLWSLHCCSSDVGSRKAA